MLDRGHCAVADKLIATELIQVLSAHQRGWEQ